MRCKQLHPVQQHIHGEIRDRRPAPASCDNLLPRLQFIKRFAENGIADDILKLQLGITFESEFGILQGSFNDIIDSHACGLWRLIECRSEEHTSELQSRGHLVCRLLLEKKK